MIDSMRNSLICLVLLLATGQTGIAQRAADTTATIKEFNAVMAFAVQPYVYYTSVTALRSGPMLAPADTGRILHGRFYKYEDDLYYGNEQEEMYLQDSLMIWVDHHRKTIRIGKVDVATKKNMDLLPLSKKDRQKLLRSGYIIGQLPDRGDTGAIVFRTKTSHEALQTAGTEVLLEYTKKEHLPLLMRMTTRVREQQTEAISTMLRSSGFDVQRMGEDVDGVRSLIMTETASVRFGTMETTKEKAMQMPVWKDKIAYDPLSGNFSGKGNYYGYQVIKTF
jgi:hypothetical protein